jgi:Bacterial SH3 domain
MEPNNSKSLFAQPFVVIGGLATLAAIGGATVAMMQPTPQSVSQRETINVTSSAADRNHSSDSGTSSDQTQGQDQDSRASSGSSSSSSNLDNEDLNQGGVNKVERCATTMAKIADPNPPANVRSKPNSANGTIVGSLKNDTFVTVTESNDSWLKISTPTKGWVSKTIAFSGCNQKEERVAFAKGSTRTTIGDEFIGTGSHTYKLYLIKGQTIRLRADRGPRPTILNPQGQTLVETADSASAWSGKLDQSGDYQFIVESNFKGYKYSFEVVAQ